MFCFRYVQTDQIFNHSKSNLGLLHWTLIHSPSNNDETHNIITTDSLCSHIGDLRHCLLLVQPSKRRSFGKSLKAVNCFRFDLYPFFNLTRPQTWVATTMPHVSYFAELTQGCPSRSCWTGWSIAWTMHQSRPLRVWRATTDTQSQFQTHVN